MLVLIRDLPPEIQELCHLRQREQGQDGIFDGDICDGPAQGNFYWDQTPEHRLDCKFWGKIYDGKIAEAMKSPAWPNPGKVKDNYSIF